MHSKIFGVLLFFFLLFALNNVFAVCAPGEEHGYKFYMDNVTITTIANEDDPPGPKGPSPIGENAYVRKGHGNHQVLYGDDDPPTGEINPDWFALEFDLTNLSTKDDCTDRDVGWFLLRIVPYYISSPSNLYVNYIWDAVGGNQYTDAENLFKYGSTIHYRIPLKANGINNSNDFFQVHRIKVRVDFENDCGGDDGGDDCFTPLWDEDVEDEYPNVEVYDPDYAPSQAEIIHDLDVFLDPFTCCEKDTLLPVIPAPVDADGVIRCDNPAYDQNRICYEIMVEDVNAMHDGIEHHLELDRFSMSLALTSYKPVRRTIHANTGWPPGNDEQYIGFPPTCNFVYYADDSHKWHYECGISQEEESEHSIPPLFTKIEPCPDGVMPGDPGWDPDCSDQDQNVFYNVNHVTPVIRNLDPEEFTMNFTDRIIIPGSIKLARGGGNYIAYARIYYKVYDSLGNEVRSKGKQMFTNENNRSYTGSNSYDPEVIKLGGHDAYVMIEEADFMPKTIIVRPMENWVVQVPIMNQGFPWDGMDDLGNPSEKDVLYVKVNLLTQTWEEISKTVTIGGADSDFPLGLDTDESRVFDIGFPVPEGMYQMFLRLATMRVKLYDSEGWIFDLSNEKPVANIRLIHILNPLMEKMLIERGEPEDVCYTDSDYERSCWWSPLIYPLTGIDLNANQDINFTLRMRSAFDFSEHFDLSYDTDAPVNARLDFTPKKNFIPPFTGGWFGYNYAVMTLKNPAILHGDANYNIHLNSEKYPGVGDTVVAQFRTFSHNLKIESFKLEPERGCYSLGESVDFEMKIKNAGDLDAYGVNFKVVSATDSTNVLHAEDDFDIAAGNIQVVTGTLPVIPYKGVFEVEATIETVEFEFDLTDNDATAFMTVCYEGDVSNLPETNYFALIFIVLIVLFVVIKK